MENNCFFYIASLSCLLVFKTKQNRIFQSSEIEARNLFNQTNCSSMFEIIESKVFLPYSSSWPTDSLERVIIQCNRSTYTQD